jgi:hypothetical protein
MNKKLVCLAATAVAGVFAFAVPPAGPPKPPKPPKLGGGTDILHLFLREPLANEGLLTNATGWVNLGQNRQGHADNQRLDIAVANLETNAEYGIWAALGDDTNFVFAGNLTTTSKGGGLVRFMQVGSSNGQAPGKGKTPLPAVLDPISNIRGLLIANVNTQAVLAAELREPEKLQYLVKRAWAEGDAVADLRLKATTRKVQFSLLAGGLAPAQDYLLAVNGDVVAGGTSGTNGALIFTSLPVAPEDILKVRTLAIWDSASNSVLSTTLP